MAAIRGAIGTRLIMDGLLVRFEIASSPLGDLTGGLALPDAGLLIAAAIIDVVTL
jgi:hypothetical protein